MWLKIQAGMINISLCNFEHPEQSQSPQCTETKGVGSVMKVDPEDFKHRAWYNQEVKAVERGLEEGGST